MIKRFIGWWRGLFLATKADRPPKPAWMDEPPTRAATRPSLPKAMRPPEPSTGRRSWWVSLQGSGPGRLTETKVAGRDYVKFEQFAGDAAEPFNVAMIPVSDLGKFEIVPEQFARSSIRRPKAPVSACTA